MGPPSLIKIITISLLSLLQLILSSPPTQLSNINVKKDVEDGCIIFLRWWLSEDSETKEEEGKDEIGDDKRIIR